MGDLCIDPRGASCSWERISGQLPRYAYATAKTLYANMVQALREYLRSADPPPDVQPF